MVKPQYGVPLVAEGECNGVCVEVWSDGTVGFLESSADDGTVDDLLHATNAALRTLHEGSRKFWWESGMDLGEAIENLPRDVLDDATLDALRLTEICAPGTAEREAVEAGVGSPSSVAVRANAVPEILDIELRESADGETVLFDLLKQLRVAIRTALSCRREVLRRRESTSLTADVAACRWLKEYLDSHFERNLELDDASMWMMMPVGEGSQAKARSSVPRLLSQARAAGKRVDFLLGLNHGASFEDIEKVIDPKDTQIIHLYVNESQSTGERGAAPLRTTEDVFTNPEMTGESFVIDAAHDNRHRLFVIHQAKTDASAGKNRMQKLCCRMLLDRLVLGKGTAVPSTMFLADADTWLFEGNASNDHSTKDPSPAALANLFLRMQSSAWDLIGARGKFTRFREDADTDVPDFAGPIPEIYELLDDAHGSGLNCMHGGATLGKFTTLLSLLSVICHRYPGSRNEDVHYTILSKTGGVPCGIAQECVATNRVHGDPESQLRRWYAASAGLRKLYGNRAFTGLNNGKQLLEEATKRGISPETIAQHLALIQYAKDHPDSPFGTAEWKES